MSLCRSRSPIRRAFDRGELFAFAPPFLRLEVLNVAGRRWRWSEPELIDLAMTLDGPGLVLHEPSLGSVARWTARGLTAYDAAYMALAEEIGLSS